MRSQAIRDSARGEYCTVNIAGVCSYDPETTVLAHLPDESHGMGKKSDDISVCYACSACHDAIDLRVNSGEYIAHADFYLRRANIRTIRRLIQSGIISVKGLK